MFIDIDSFKQIKDVYGHTGGDRLLKNVADILKNICNEFPSSVCARHGGDEFAVMYVSKDGGDAAPLIRKIYKNIEIANKKDSFDYTTSISIGCSRYGGMCRALKTLL